jgi:hypothetical protein
MMVHGEIFIIYSSFKAGLGLCTVPLGGCLEREISQELSLPSEDRVLYVGVCGAPETAPLRGLRSKDASVVNTLNQVKK